MKAMGLSIIMKRAGIFIDIKYQLFDIVFANVIPWKRASIIVSFHWNIV